ncbi:MAG: leucyl aminopeptidase [Alphaproteobacteria bacterium]|nr:leucyl aminopeptidase [Alphaproteobacteria bacterium]MCD8571393.1 leucyl aminopeptidase [Alphaproteobacteria bacterium]
MALNIEFVEKPSSSSEILIVPVGSDKQFTLPDGMLKAETIESIKYNLESDPKFKGKPGETFSVPLPKGEAYRSVIFAGFQTDAKDIRPTAVIAAEAGGKLYPALKNAWAKAATFVVTPELLKNEQDRAAGIARIGFGLTRESYEFKKYKDEPKDKKDAPVKLETVEFVTPKAKDATEAYKPLKALAGGVFFARDLVYTAPNDLYPESFAKIIKEGEKKGLKVEIFDTKALEKMGANGIISVGKGSANPPYMAVMTWKGKNCKETDPLVFVGKGVTFDSGGISIKPAAGMEEMSRDMGGAAAVTGLMDTLASREANEYVVGIVGLAENMPSANAVKPSDVYKSLDGKTVEVLNTDAEGRLVLSDCITYAQKNFKPRLIVDAATLTGACMVALGNRYAGIFVNDDKVLQKLQQAGTATGEKVWHLPLDDEFEAEVKGKNTDLKNMGNGRYGGASTAAAFLKAFIKDDTPWGHVDMAGPGIDKPGYGVELFNNFVEQHEP